MTLLLSSIFLIGYSQQKEFRYQVTHIKICEFLQKTSLAELEEDLSKFCTPYTSIDSGHIKISMLPFTINIEQPGNDLITMILLDEESKRSVYYDKDLNARFRKLPGRDQNNNKCIVYVSEFPIKSLYNSRLCIIRWENKILYQILKPLKL